MDKVYGSPKRQDGLYKVGRNKYELIYGFGKDNENDETGWNYRLRFNHLPTLDEIKSAIIATVEQVYANRLRYGLEWNGSRVEYTEERKSDLTGLIVALQGGLIQLPITLNLGTSQNGSPVFHEFTTAEELASVAVALSNHKISVCEQEWNEKYSIDWSVFGVIK